MTTAHFVEPSCAPLGSTPGVDGVPRWIDRQLVRCPIEEVAVADLGLVGSPRRGGTDVDHVRMFAELAEELPPIVVHRPSWRVIDGAHRVQAARERGVETLWARIYDGAESDAFLLSVGLNVAHGLPLARADRVAAARRIVATHRDWSDRMIAVATGLSAGSVAQQRRTAPAVDECAVRIGRDGRVRPLDIAVGRRLAGELMAQYPEASLRSIARDAGVSPATAHDVRRRLKAGLSVVPDGARRADAPRPAPRPGGRPPVAVDLDATLSLLREDPALRFNQAGRGLLRWLDHHLRPATDWDAVVAAVPRHCGGLVARMARTYAQTWSDFAARLESR